MKMRKINKIIIHCTATSQEAKVKSILDYWKNTLKWRNPGYHILIDKDGGKHYLHDFTNIANGVQGHNSDSIHISYIGGVDQNNKPLDNRTEAQKASIIQAIREVYFFLERLQQPGYKEIKIYGHNDFSNKACPSFDAKKEYEWITV
jgi:N-acetylmuramoyl-L-alanine amidase